MPTRGKEQWKKSTFYCAGRKATLATGRKFWQEQFVQKGKRGRGHGFCLASTSQTPTRSLPPRTAAAHGTKRHTWSRWLSKNKGFYQFVCHPSTIYLCNVSSHSSTLVLKHFPFASEAPRTFMWEHIHTPAEAMGHQNRGAVTSIWERADTWDRINPPDWFIRILFRKGNPNSVTFSFFEQYKPMVLNTQNFYVWHCFQQSLKLTQLTGQWAHTMPPEPPSSQNPLILACN